MPIAAAELAIGDIRQAMRLLLTSVISRSSTARRSMAEILPSANLALASFNSAGRK